MRRAATSTTGLLLLLVPLSGCRNACEQRCSEMSAFYEECADALEEAGYPIWCYDEVKAHPDGTVDRESRRECDDGPDAERSCLKISHARADALTSEDNDERLSECSDETDLDNAIADLDCDDALEALANLDPY